jgi:hypothetical protein
MRYLKRSSFFVFLIYFIVMIVFVIIMAIPGVYGLFGVSTEENGDNPYSSPPGGVGQTYFLLQNFEIDGSEGEDITVEAELLSGGEIAEFVNGLIFDVPADGSVQANVIVEIPEDVSLGTEYEISVLFRPFSVEGEGENLQLVAGIGKSIPVIVGETQTSPSSPDYIETDRGKVRGFGGGIVWFLVFLILVTGIIAVVVFMIVIVRREGIVGREPIIDPTQAKLNNSPKRYLGSDSGF